MSGTDGLALMAPDDPFEAMMRPPDNETPSNKAARLRYELDAKRTSELIDAQLNAQRRVSIHQHKMVQCLILGHPETEKWSLINDFRMRYAREECEAEHLVHRRLVQLTVVHAINTIIDALRLWPDAVPHDRANLTLRLGPLQRLEEDLQLQADRKSGSDEPRTSETRRILAACAEDMKALWRDDSVKIMRNSGIFQLGSGATFFLNNLDRITQEDYEPIDDDVSRLQRSINSIQEYYLTVTVPSPSAKGAETAQKWVLYSFCGSGTVRNAWMPFLEDLDAIVFLMPVASFDERLPDNPHLNRLQDSMSLWRSICSSKFFLTACLILILCECDLLESKLNSGIRFRDHVTNYGDRSNNAISVLGFLRPKLKAITKEYSPESRLLHFTQTRTTDTNQTTSTMIVNAVQSSIMRGHLRASSLVR